MTTFGRTTSTEALVKRASEGLLSNKYKPLDYDKLKALAAEKKSSGKASYAKVKKLEQVTKQNKEQHLMKQHKRAWQHELSHLDSIRSKCQSEVDSFMLQTEQTEISSHFISNLQNYEIKLEKEQTDFKKQTVIPVWELRDDLLYWIGERKGVLQAKGRDLGREGDKVLETVRSVQLQQSRILNQLQQEQLSLEKDLKFGILGEISSHNSGEKDVQTGIPEEAFLLECPNDELKAAVLQEFILIDEKHMEKLKDIDELHQEAIGSDTGGWPEDEDLMFQAILEQYPYNLQNRRQLYIDRLLRHLPHRTRNEIVAHENWSQLYKYYHKRRKDLIHDWLRDRMELMNRAVMVFDEAIAAQKLAETKAEFRHQQKAICDALYQKVAAWRENKMELLQLEQELEQERRDREQEQIRLEQEKERKRRQAEKDKINKYVEELEVCRKTREKEKRRRYEELQLILAEQAARDKERVEFRHDQFLDRVEQKRERRDAEERDREKTEERLEALRQQVRPNVERDLLRVWSDTEAWNAHLKGGEEDKVNIQKPLFQINTFASNKVTADPRFKVEQRLREAGLLETQYARQVMTQIQPLQPQRKDMESTVFRNT